MQPAGTTPSRHGRRSRVLAAGVLLAGLALSVAGWWYAGADRGPEFSAQRQHLLPWLILCAGLASAVTTGGVLWALASGRARALGRADRAADSLQQTEAQARRLALVASHTASSVMLTDADWKIEWVNDSFTRFFGYTAEEAIGRRPGDLLHGPETNLEVLAAINAACDAGRSFKGEILNYTKSGRTHWIELDVQPLRDERGTVVGYMGLHLDVTERKRFEQELARKEAQFRFIFEASPVGISWKLARPDGSKVRLVNEAHVRICGLSREEAEQPGAFAAISDPEEMAAQDRLTARLEAGEIEEFSMEKRYKRRDGATVWVMLTRQRRGYADGSIEDLTTIVDITEFKRTQEMLAAQEARFRFIFELVPVGLSWFEVGRQREMHLVNSAHARITGVPMEKSTQPEAYAGATHPDDQARQIKLTERLQRGESDHFTLEKRYLHPNGEVVWVVLTVRIFRDPATGVGQQVATLVDVTELKHQAEELRTAMEIAERASLAKSQFLAMVSHEIRTPMNGVIGMTSLLLDSPLSREQQEYVETIRQSGDSLLTIINDILDFSKIESGRLEFESADFALRECVEGALDLMAPKVAEKRLDLLYEIADNVPGTVRGDTTRLRQILINLLGNAVKFTTAGEIVLKLEASPKEDGRIELAFSVRDTGIGIAPEAMQRLFQSFSQVDASTTRRFGGTGLGLAISKRLAELMGGTMWLESEVGRGSTFYFTVVVDSVSSKPRPYLTAGKGSLAGKRLLIVDDNATNRRILTTLLAGWGISSQAASSGIEALGWLRESQPFDAVILDMQMPEMDGVMLAQEMRRLRPAPQLPFILLSSLGQREFVPDQKLFAAYLTKPAKPSQIHDVLAALLKDDGAAQKGTAHPFGAPPPLTKFGEVRRTDRLLLAEDNAVNQRVALLMLGKLGYRADVAANGNEVLEAVRRQTYDVILMDVQMPELDGLEATRLIVQQWPERRDRPWIIAITANAMQGDRDRCIEAGMDDYISKPIKLEELATALERAHTAHAPKE
ncbi:MAG TPA: PAS domain S-box protein [Opitutaceae bacterium]|nr:PAS domain S-box protein [Opitutaceae bacterium]